MSKSQSAKPRKYSWALEMQHPKELQKLSRLSYFGTGLGKGLQEPEWDFKSVVDTQTYGRLFMHKSPRDTYSVDLKREMVANDRRLKNRMRNHRQIMQRESHSLDRTMRNSEKPYICQKGDIKAKFGEKFNELPSSLHVHKGTHSIETSTQGTAPLTVEDAGTVLSEQYVVCHRCKKTYKEGRNTETSCRYHLGPILAVFGGMCQYCGMLDYTDGCVVGFHARRKPTQALTAKRKKQKT